MGLFDDSSFEEQLWTDAWIDEVDREARLRGMENDDSMEIQDQINSGIYTRDEIKNLHGLDDSDFPDFDTSLMDDDF